MMIKLSQNIIRWIIAVPCVLLTVCLVLYRAYRHSELEKDRLTLSLEEFQDKERQSVLIQRVSQQMEEIAYQQKDISEKRRQEAVAQTRKANQMQQQAEIAREKAFTAQWEAEKAYRLADEQKNLAMERQLQAEQSKRVADTLAFLALGRSLGTLSVTQYRSGNMELASLLAYTSWQFTKHYDGDVYHPAVFNALSLSCRQDQLWFRHKGAITGIRLLHETIGNPQTCRDSLPGLVTVSKYGEMICWKSGDGQTYTSGFLLSDSRYDFRDVLIHSDSLVYALSYDGCLVSVNSAGMAAYLLPEGKYRQLIPAASDRLLAISATGIYAFDCISHQIQLCFQPEYPVTCVGKSGDNLYVFLKNGTVALLSSAGQFVRFIEGWSQGGRITSFCSLSDERYAVGCREGTILICDKDGNVQQKLIGHQAAVTAIFRKGNKLFSSSYDCTLRLWDLHKGKTESAVIMISSGWIHTFCLHPDGTSIFMGDEQGRLYRIPVSPDHMATVVRQGLRRDFTQEEWEYYVGKQIPFESYYLKTYQP